uniref:Uncharacterized protein n=1 Tax=Amphimedon queenslandica TaxID=400682 RepID=A0A1X7SP71_AMPQE
MCYCTIIVHVYYIQFSQFKLMINSNSRLRCDLLLLEQLLSWVSW